MFPTLPQVYDLRALKMFCILQFIGSVGIGLILSLNSLTIYYAMCGDALLLLLLLLFVLV